jgi:hypothetical protein
MLVSLNELESTTKKAFRGLGYHWGEAEEAGKAAVWLASHGLPVLPPVLGLLHHVEDDGLAMLRPARSGEPWISSSGSLCPICVGIALSDRAPELPGIKRLDLNRVMSPVLILPFLFAISLETARPISMGWNDFSCTVIGHNVSVSMPRALSAEQATVSLLVGEIQPELDRTSLVPILPAAVEPLLWDGLCRFASRTYVPASEHSRRAGAGAGLTDND